MLKNGVRQGLSYKGVWGLDREGLSYKGVWGLEGEGTCCFGHEKATAARGAKGGERREGGGGGEVVS